MTPTDQPAPKSSSAYGSLQDLTARCPRCQRKAPLCVCWFIPQPPDGAPTLGGDETEQRPTDARPDMPAIPSDPASRAAPPVAKSAPTGVVPQSICPQCGASTIQPRDRTAYCEECGWPDENREGPSELAFDVANKVIGKFCPEGHDDEEFDQLVQEIDRALATERATRPNEILSALLTAYDQGGISGSRLAEVLGCPPSPAVRHMANLITCAADLPDVRAKLDALSE